MFKQIFIVILLITMSVDASKLASKFVRKSLDIQYGIAKIVSKALGKDVILFCIDGTEKDAESKILNGYRYLESNDSTIYVLSAAAQEVFTTTNTYVQFSTNPVVSDASRVILKFN